MKKPETEDKKYHYFHKKANKKMFNNAQFEKDIIEYRKWLVNQNNQTKVNHGE